MANKQWSIMRCIEMKRLNLYSWNSACINALRTFNTHFCYLFFCNLCWLETTVFFTVSVLSFGMEFYIPRMIYYTFFLFALKMAKFGFSTKKSKSIVANCFFFRAFLLKWHRIIDSFVHLRLLFFLLICRRCTLICMLKYRFANTSH